jgi:hypothetical protein
MDANNTVTVNLPTPPIDMVNRLLTSAGAETVDFPAYHGQLKLWWSGSSSNVSSAVVPDFGQKGNENYILAYIAFTGVSPATATERAFEVLVDESLQQAADRAGHGDVDLLPSHAVTSIQQTAASEVVKRIWTTAHFEKALGEALGTPAAPETYADAVTREIESIDVVLADGRKFQVKSLAGERDGDFEHIWTPNFEDYFFKQEIEAKVGEKP